MDRTRYIALGAFAGDWLHELIPRPLPVDRLAELKASSGVYVIADALERTVYVGSVCRPGRVRGVAGRIREHLREPAKKLVWHSVWVLPLRDDTPVDVVRRVEGAVGVDLAPRSSQRLPRI